MSLPPQVIQVKRKRTEEGPVPSFLRIEHTTKRHRSDAFLYRRHDPQAAATALAAKRAAEAEAEAAGRTSRPPTIQSSKKGDEKRKKPGDNKDEPTPITPSKTTTTAPKTTLPTTSAPAAEPRRFHLSRDSLMAAHSGAASVLGISGMAGVRKRSRYSSGATSTSGGGHEPAAIFVERSKRQRKIVDAAARKQQLRRNRDVKSSGSGSGNGSGNGGMPETGVAGDRQVALPSITEAPAPLPKRPGRRGGIVKETGSGASTGGASTPVPAETAVAAASDGSDSNANVTDDTQTQTSSKKTIATANPALPPSLRNRQWDTDMDQLTRDMNNYTLEIIGRNLAQMNQVARAVADAKQPEADHQRGEMSKLANERRRAAYAKYKPKPPGMRYVERQGDNAAKGNASNMSEDETLEDEDDEGEQDDISETDEEDYVTETYVRIPGHEAAKAQAGGAVVPGSVGLLVFDNDPDLEFFYGVEEDSEEEAEDDEDENAENYYTHDYPEDEVSSDDEYGRDAYHYRTGNASDLEEFVESDGEGGEGKEAGEAIGLPSNVRLTKPGDL